MKNKKFTRTLVKTLALHELELEHIKLLGKITISLFSEALKEDLPDEKYKKEIKDIQQIMLRETNALKNPLHALTDIYIHEKYRKYFMNIELPKISQPVKNKICSLLEEIKILNEIEKAEKITEANQNSNVEQKKSFTP